MLLVPVFAGHTSFGELVVLYRADDDRDSHLYLRRPDGSTKPLDSMSSVKTWISSAGEHLEVEAQLWSGHALGTRELAQAAEAVHYPTDITEYIDPTIR
jgi:hypothetical protein